MKSIYSIPRSFPLYLLLVTQLLLAGCASITAHTSNSSAIHSLTVLYTNDEHGWMEDGNAEVFETIYLTDEEARELGWSRGSISIQVEGIGDNDGVPFLARRTIETLRDGTPRIVRREYVYYQVSSGSELGKSITYSRIGSGAILTLATGSSFSCADIEGFNLDIADQIFQIE